MGLFQQLAYQKVASEKKENKMAADNNTKPFQFSGKKSAGAEKKNQKNTFAALLQNVK